MISMRLILCFFQFVMMASAFTTSIEDLIPGCEPHIASIKVTPRNVGDLTIYDVQEFEELNKNRNHFDARNGDAIQFLVMHYTVADFNRTMDIFTTDVDSGRVSAHYVITQTEENQQVPGGRIFQVVPEEKRAWHAGVSKWKNVTNLNHASIGIENVNAGFVGDEAGAPEWFKFDEAQVNALGQLSRSIIDRYKIIPQNVVGHADIAPDRKQDPGILFPWGELHEKFGVGAWLLPSERTSAAITASFSPEEPLPQGVSDAFFLSQLRTYGYTSIPEDAGVITPELRETVNAFKAHFSSNQDPAGYNTGVNESDMLWAWGLGAKYKD